MLAPGARCHRSRRTRAPSLGPHDDNDNDNNNNDNGTNDTTTTTTTTTATATATTTTTTTAATTTTTTNNNNNNNKAIDRLLVTIASYREAHLGSSSSSSIVQIPSPV